MPGAGKTSLDFPLAAELGYSLVTKDLIKETLYDALYVPGEGDIDWEWWSGRLSGAPWELLFAVAAHAGDMVIEANFHPHSDVERDKLLSLCARPSRCTACARPRSRSPATTPGRTTRSTCRRCRCRRWTNTTGGEYGGGTAASLFGWQPEGADHRRVAGIGAFGAPLLDAGLELGERRGIH
jgi:hypothetical protein